MATYNYGPITQKGRNLILKYGTTCVLTREGSSGGWTRKYEAEQMRYYWENNTSGAITYDEPSTAEISSSGICVLTAFSKEELSDTLINISDVKLVVMDIIEPELGDIITVGSIDYQYVRTLIAAPDGNTILYILQVRT